MEETGLLKSIGFLKSRFPVAVSKAVDCEAGKLNLTLLLEHKDPVEYPDFPTNPDFRLIVDEDPFNTGRTNP